MTKKHFIQLASMIRGQIEFAQAQVCAAEAGSVRTAKGAAALAYATARKHAAEYMAQELARICGASNPRFNRDRFLNACGVDPSAR